MGEFLWRFGKLRGRWRKPDSPTGTQEAATGEKSVTACVVREGDAVVMNLSKFAEHAAWRMTQATSETWS